VAYCKENGIVVQAHSPLVKGKMDHPVFLEIATKVKIAALAVAPRPIIDEIFYL